MQQQSMAQCHVNETHAIRFTSPQEIASQIMKAFQVSSCEKPSILGHNGDTIYIGLSTLRALSCLMTLISILLQLYCKIIETSIIKPEKASNVPVLASEIRSRRLVHVSD